MAMKKIQVALVEVFGLRKDGSIRLTEVGAKPLGNGASFEVPVDKAAMLVKAHPAVLRIPDATPHKVPTKEIEVEENWQHRIVSDGKTPPKAEKVEKLDEKDPIDTSSKSPTTGGGVDPSEAGKGANKSMAGRGAKG